jgi:hypothetical protein
MAGFDPEQSFSGQLRGCNCALAISCPFPVSRECRSRKPRIRDSLFQEQRFPPLGGPRRQHMRRGKPNGSSIEKPEGRSFGFSLFLGTVKRQSSISRSRCAFRRTWRSADNGFDQGTCLARPVPIPAAALVRALYYPMLSSLGPLHRATAAAALLTVKKWE